MDPPTYTESERHPELYFDDGDVMILAPIPDGGRRIFRVHAFLLSLKSPVLATMLAQPPPDGVKLELRDGARIISVVENAIDWEKILHGLYDSK